MRSNTVLSQPRVTVAAGHNGALVGLSGPGKHSYEEGSLDLCMRRHMEVDDMIGAVGSCVKDSVGLKGSRVLGIASGWVATSTRRLASKRLAVLAGTKTTWPV